MADLDAKHYRKNSSTQYASAYEVLNTVHFRGNETILDVGCGDGRITAELSLLVPSGRVIGIDPSASMIELASTSFCEKDYPNLSFKQFSAEDMCVELPVDMILMMNTLHWIRNPKRAIRNFFTSLKSEGSLVILTYPKESPYWKFLEDTIEEEEWKSYIQQSASKTMLSTQEYRQLIEESGFSINDCVLEEKTAVYSSLNDLKAYIKGWLNCYLSLPGELESKFLEKAAKNAQRYSLSKSLNEIRLTYFQLTLKAQKKKGIFAVIYQGYVKQGRELEYQSAWHKIAAYFSEKRGALGSCLHHTDDNLWVAYSRWPDKATRDASWPKENTPSSELPQEIQQAIITLKSCIERQLPEIGMEVIDDLSIISQ